MKQIIIAFMMLSLLVPGSVARALDESALLLTDEQITLVRDNCLTTQATLTRIHANDGLVRVNYGQQFEMLSSRLMAPLNSRIAVNKLDGVELAKTTVDYNKEIDNFRKLYRDYEQTAASLIRMDCRNQPVGFYDSIASMRQKRAFVYESVSRMQELVKQYRTQFSEFRQVNFAGES